MWEILTLASLALVGGALVQRRRPQAWQALARSCGLEVVKVSTGLTRPQLEARAGPATVRIESISRSTGYSLRVLATFPRQPGLFSSFKICRKGPGLHDLEVGDELFDRRFSVEGSAQVITALLDEETRRLLLVANLEGVLEISGSELRLDTFDRNLRTHLPLLLILIRRLAGPVDIVQCLARNARQDPAAGVRLRNLLTLIRDFPEDSRTPEALRTACSDPSPRLRLRAARELGAERRDILFGLAEGLEDDAVSAEAVSILARELPFERARAILADALSRRSLQTVRACLEVLGTSGDPTAVDVLAKVLALEKGELAAAAALALGETGSPAAEPALIEAIQREPADLRVAVADALGRVGSAAAVLSLQETAEHFPKDQDLEHAARRSIAEIQSRLQGASPGQLSMAEDEAGQLSLAQAEVGQLSLAPAEAGLLPHPTAESEQPSPRTHEAPAVRQV